MKYNNDPEQRMEQIIMHSCLPSLIRPMNQEYTLVVLVDISKA
jgi:hypothetical protein